MSPLTIGIDIGTTSVKAVAVDDDGSIVARTRVPHRIYVPAPDLMEHDAAKAWRSGPLKALRSLPRSDVAGIAVAAMVPSMTAVDRRGRPLTPGLLYGDARGRRPGAAAGSTGPEGSGEQVGFLRWTADAAPEAHGYWPAQGVANRALGGPPAVDLGVAFTSVPLYGAGGWDEQICRECGASPDQLAPVEMTGAPIARLQGDGPALAAGTVDVWCEQLVAGAREVGDVHVICGTSLIVWAKVGEPVEVPGLWTVGASGGGHLVGGASNAGGLFLEWANRLSGRTAVADRLDPADIPVWTPYPRGERTPYHDPSKRAAVHGLDLTHGPAALQRAAWEASGFVVRHHLDLAAVKARRIVATGGGTRVSGWMQALADTTSLPVHVAADPEGAAVGAAFVARCAAGIESDVESAARWARTGHVVDPDARWSLEAESRYKIFLERSGRPGEAYWVG